MDSFLFSKIQVGETNDSGSLPQPPARIYGLLPREVCKRWLRVRLYDLTVPEALGAGNAF